MTLKAKQRIHAIDKHQNDYSMIWNRYIPYDVNTLNNIYLNSNFFDEISTTFYNKRSDIFEYLLRIIIKPSVNNIGHPSLPE